MRATMRAATRAVTQSQHERARALLGPALEAMRGEDTCPASVPAAMVHALSGLNAATLCGLHVGSANSLQLMVLSYPRRFIAGKTDGRRTFSR